MYAILRDSTYDTARLAQASETMTEFQDRHSSQPGYRGNVIVDAGDGRRLTLTIWETENHAAGDAQAIAGGFWATLLLVPLTGARAPAVVLRLMPDGPLAGKETIFQQQAARPDLPVPEIFLAGDADAGLGRPLLVMAHAPAPRHWPASTASRRCGGCPQPP